MSQPTPLPKRCALAGSLYLAAIGLSLMLMGGVFFAVMWSSFQRALAMDAWPRTECVILESSIEETQHDPNSPLTFRHRLLFGYEVDGQRFTSDRFELRGNPWYSNPGLAQAMTEKYPVGTRTQCLVDPEDHQQAVLKADSKAPGYTLWFPATFFIGGLVMTGRAVFTILRR